MTADTLHAESVQGDPHAAWQVENSGLRVKTGDLQPNNGKRRHPTGWREAGGANVLFELQVVEEIASHRIAAGVATGIMRSFTRNE